MPHQCTSYSPPMSLVSDLCLRSHDAKVSDDVLAYFPSSSLPRDPESRFRKLFEVREVSSVCLESETLGDGCPTASTAAFLLQGASLPRRRSAGGRRTLDRSLGRC